MKPKTLFLIFNHRLTDAQKTDAQKSLGVTRFLALPEELQEYWSAIRPQGELDYTRLKAIGRWIVDRAEPGDYVLVQGDAGASFYLVDFCLQKGLTPVYATTRRQARETINNRGQVEKVSQFEHVAFRKYRRWYE